MMFSLDHSPYGKVFDDDCYFRHPLYPLATEKTALLLLKADDWPYVQVRLNRAAIETILGYPLNGRGLTWEEANTLYDSPGKDWFLVYRRNENMGSCVAVWVQARGFRRQIRAKFLFALLWWIHRNWVSRFRLWNILRRQSRRKRRIYR